MAQDEKIGEAQKILNWIIAHLNLSMKCKVIDYGRKNYQVQLFTKEDQLIMPVQISEEWIRESNPGKNFVHDKLKILLKNLENYL
jgi:hypothetical protein